MCSANWYKYLLCRLNVIPIGSYRIEFINIINQKACKCSAVYIVDSFGEMRTNELLKILNIFNKNLNPDIRIGFHSHNNLQLSYSNAIEFIH